MKTNKMVKDEEKNSNESLMHLITGLTFGLVFGILGNLIILLADKLFFRFYSDKILIIIFGFSNLFLLILLLFISYLYLNLKKSLK